jgi:hypothetical protein
MKKCHSEAGMAGNLIVIAIAVGLVVVGLGFYGYASSVRNTALAWETDLNKSVRVEISERATYETSIVEQLGLVDQKAEKMKEIISAAISGRYGDNPNQGQALFQAVAEAYPGTEGLKHYDKIHTSVVSGREAIRNKQNLRIEKAQAYNYWRKEGILRPMILGSIYPSRDLHFRVGSKDYYAVDALDKMSEPISTQNVNDTFERGVEKPIRMK